MREQKPVIGMRVSLGILAMFEHHKRAAISSAQVLPISTTAACPFFRSGGDSLRHSAGRPEALRGQDALDGLTPENVPASSKTK
ncbi:MAG: hypothetical protein ACLUMK_14475 [Christensenellales bacterium]